MASPTRLLPRGGRWDWIEHKPHSTAVPLLRTISIKMCVRICMCVHIVYMHRCVFPLLLFLVFILMQSLSTTTCVLKTSIFTCERHYLLSSLVLTFHSWVSLWHSFMGHRDTLIPPPGCGSVSCLLHWPNTYINDLFSMYSKLCIAEPATIYCLVLWVVYLQHPTHYVWRFCPQNLASSFLISTYSGPHFHPTAFH